jgi:hypothetical protein
MLAQCRPVLDKEGFLSSGLADQGKGALSSDSELRGILNLKFFGPIAAVKHARHSKPTTAAHKVTTAIDPF